MAFVGKVMSLLFNMLSRLVITFLPWSKRLVISWLQSPSAVIWEPKKIKSVTASTFFPSICFDMIGQNAVILVFWILSFKPAFSLSSFIFIKKFFSSSSLSVIRVVSFAYLRLLMFLPPILFQLVIIQPGISHDVLSIHVKQTGWQQIALSYSLLDLEPISCSIQGFNYCFLIGIQVSQETGKMA